VKVYMLTEKDFEDLLMAIDRDPMWGSQGGSSQAQVRDKAQNQAHEDAHRFYNFQLRRWITQVKS